MQQASQLRLRRVATELRLWEKSLSVQQQLLLVNGGSAPVDLGSGKLVDGRRLSFPLPDGATGVRASGSGAVLLGQRIVLSGSLRPGDEHAVTLQVSYQLPTSSSVFTFRQPLPLPPEDLLTIVPREPVVHDRPVAGVALRMVDHNHRELAEKVIEKATSWALQGVASPGGGSAAAGPGGPAGPPGEILLTVAGLPARSLAPAWAAVVLSFLLIVAGALAGRPGHGGGRPAEERGAPPSGERRSPADERARLWERLEQQERQWQAGGGGGGSGGSGRAWPGERSRLIRRLAELDTDGGPAREPPP